MSSLINAFIGEERNIVTDIAGTTRDSIYTRYDKFGFDFYLVDTAGIRRKSKITEDRWVEWGELKGVKYEGSDPPVPEPTPEKGYAIVTGKNLALREGPSTLCKVITRAPTGTKVKIEPPPSEWEYVSYNGKTGYMMKEFLKEG